MFRVAFSALPQLGKKWRKLTEKFDKALTGKSVERPRWDTCMRRLYGTFGVPMSALYVNHHFDPESLDKVNHFCRITKPFTKMIVSEELQITSQG
jgi:predicted metalloendopeptidase